MSEKYDKLNFKENDYNNSYNNPLRGKPSPSTNFGEEYLDQFLLQVQRDPKRVKDVPPIYKTEDKYRDKYFEIVVAALSKDGMVIEHLPEFQSYPGAAKIATTQNPKAAQFFDEEIRFDDSFMMPLVEKQGTLLQFSSPSLRDREETVLLAIQHGGSLDHASSRLKDKEDFLLEVIETRPMELKYASPRLKKDEEFMEAVIDLNPRAFGYAQTSLKRDTSFCLDMIEKGHLEIFDNFEYSVRSNPEVITAFCDKMAEYDCPMSKKTDYYIENPYEFAGAARDSVRWNESKINETREAQKQSIEL